MTNEQKLARCAYVLGVTVGAISDLSQFSSYDYSKTERLKKLEAFVTKECSELFYDEKETNHD